MYFILKVSFLLYILRIWKLCFVAILNVLEILIFACMYAMYSHVGLLMLLTQSFVLTAFVCGVLFGFGHCTERMSEMSRTHEAPSLTLHKYTAKQLVDLKPPGKLNLPWQTWASIRDTGIGMKGPTRRGKRAGKTPYIASAKSPFVPDCPISIPPAPCS